jgi:hypothetical protein
MSTEYFIFSKTEKHLQADHRQSRRKSELTFIFTAKIAVNDLASSLAPFVSVSLVWLPEKRGVAAF